MIEILSEITSSLTTMGVFFAAWQLRLSHQQLKLSHQQCVTNFEDSFAKEYRELASTLPTKALLGDALTNKEHEQYFDEMYHYVDLCNQQAFLRKAGRISDGTWKFWHDGIASNLKRTAFVRAWAEIAARANDDFSELREFFPPADLPIKRR